MSSRLLSPAIVGKRDQQGTRNKALSDSLGVVPLDGSY